MFSRAVRFQRSGAAIPSLNTWSQPLQRSRKFTTSLWRSQKTYFQDESAFQNASPQTPKKPRRFLFFTIGGLVGTVSGAILAIAGYDKIFDAYLKEHIAELESIVELDAAISDATDLQAERIGYCHSTENMFDSTESATYILALRAFTEEAQGARVHSASLPSNVPCEDQMSPIGHFQPHKGTSITALGLFDGHAGPATSTFLSQWLFLWVTESIGQAQGKDCGRAWLPRDPEVIQGIKNGFTSFDNFFMNTTEQLIKGNVDTFSEHKPGSKRPESQVITIASLAFSGSCALLTLYDPACRVLRVANVGDSRAVLGRWDHSKQRYIAIPLSFDHTGFNQDEVERLRKAHPGEDVIDPKTGRLFGLAVTRAFGDSRWKWPDEVTRAANVCFWGPPPRPKGVIKTPPYLTAEPEVTETPIIADGEHPDFLIMASDGLWDVFDNQDAVHCVELWLQKYGSQLKESKPLYSHEAVTDRQRGPVSWTRLTPENVTTEPEPGLSCETGDEEVTFSKEDGSCQWRATPKHFVVEDDHCGMHLIKNALGGSRRALFEGVMSVKHPFSRNVRDDISVQVAFFKNEKLQKEGPSLEVPDLERLLAAASAPRS